MNIWPSAPEITTAKSSPLPGAHPQSPSNSQWVHLVPQTHQPSSFNHMKVPKGQIWGLIKGMTLLAPWDSLQLSKEGDWLWGAEAMRPTALSQGITWCPPHCRGTEQGTLGQAHLSASCIPPLTVTKPLTLYTPAHCNKTPRKAQFNYLSEKMTAALMSLGNGLALLLTTAWIILYPLNLELSQFLMAATLPCLDTDRTNSQTPQLQNCN